MSALTVEASPYVANGAERLRLLAPAGAPERISLVVTGGAVARDWDLASRAAAISFCRVPADPTALVGDILRNETLDLARLVLDGGFSTFSFLDVLAAVPHGRAVEILWICDGQTGYLSAMGRGGDRILYALTPEDVRFYLEVNGLVVERQILSGAS